MKLKNKIAAVLACVAAVTPLTACGGETVEGEEKIDTSRTQIYVYNFNGGYGTEWITSLKKRFEAEHATESFEEGKTGVQVMVNNKKTGMGDISSQILSNKEEIYFSEYSYYYTLKADNLLADISSVVKNPVGYGETKSIESKLSAEQKSFFGVSESDGTHYYALPHYAGYSGLIYNVDLFDEEGYYFAKTPSGSSLDDKFVSKQNPKKSAGPDGVENTADDGLPATYDEFFQLCDYIAAGGATPLVWNGFDYNNYLNLFVQALQADYEGVEQSMLNYNQGNGVANNKATTLATVSGGTVTIDPTPTPITDSNAYELARQAGKYYGLSFVEKLVKTDKYHNNKAFNTAYSHMNAQEDFLYAGHDGKTKPIAMLCDGVWWEMEAYSTFDDMVATYGKDMSKENRNFGFMPLPKATTAKVEEAASAPENAKYTLHDGIYSLCFMKKNVAEWKKPLLEEFLKFAHTDASLRDFTVVTDTVKAFNYDMGADYEKLTPFGKSLVDLKARSQVVYPYSNSAKYVNNSATFMTHNQFFSRLDGANKQYCAQQFHESNTTAETWFNGMKSYYESTWSTLK